MKSNEPNDRLIILFAIISIGFITLILSVFNVTF